MEEVISVFIAKQKEESWSPEPFSSYNVHGAQVQAHPWRPGPAVLNFSKFLNHTLIYLN